MSIRDIIVGHVNEVLSRHEEMSETRLNICKTCPLYKEVEFGPICNPRKWIHPKTGEVSDEQKIGFIKGCNCRLQAKTRVQNNHCIISKW